MDGGSLETSTSDQYFSVSIVRVKDGKRMGERKGGRVRQAIQSNALHCTVL